jgi:hypothetical protein
MYMYVYIYMYMYRYVYNYIYIGLFSPRGMEVPIHTEHDPEKQQVI